MVRNASLEKAKQQLDDPSQRDEMGLNEDRSVQNLVRVVIAEVIMHTAETDGSHLLFGPAMPGKSRIRV